MGDAGHAEPLPVQVLVQKLPVLLPVVVLAARHAVPATHSNALAHRAYAGVEPEGPVSLGGGPLSTDASTPPPVSGGPPVSGKLPLSTELSTRTTSVPGPLSSPPTTTTQPPPTAATTAAAVAISPMSFFITAPSPAIVRGAVAKYEVRGA